MCVQNLDDSRGLAIRITYRISLRSSSLWEPRHPLLKVVNYFLLGKAANYYPGNGDQLLSLLIQIKFHSGWFGVGPSSFSESLRPDGFLRYIKNAETGPGIGKLSSWFGA